MGYRVCVCVCMLNASKQCQLGQIQLLLAEEQTELKLEPQAHNLQLFMIKTNKHHQLSDLF